MLGKTSVHLESINTDVIMVVVVNEHAFYQKVMADTNPVCSNVNTQFCICKIPNRAVLITSWTAPVLLRTEEAAYTNPTDILTSC